MANSSISSASYDPVIPGDANPDPGRMGVARGCPAGFFAGYVLWVLIFY